MTAALPPSATAPERFEPTDADPVRTLASRLRYDILLLVEEFCYADRQRTREVLGALVQPDGRLDEAVFAHPDRFARALRALAALPNTPVESDDA